MRRVGFRIVCSKPMDPELLEKANKIFDKYRPSGVKPRSKAFFLWSTPADVEWWAKNCVALGGTAKIYIVDADRCRCNCMICSFRPVEEMFEGLSIGEGEEKLREYAREYWRSCRPWNGEVEPDTEVLCWCEPYQKLIGEARTEEDVERLIREAVKAWEALRALVVKARESGE